MFFFIRIPKIFSFIFQNPEVEIWKHAKTQLPWHFSSDAEQARLEQEDLVREMFGDKQAITGDDIMSDNEVEYVNIYQIFPIKFITTCNLCILLDTKYRIFHT